MSKLWKYFKGYRREAVAAPFMKMLEALLELMIPLFVAEIIDVGIAEGRSEYVWQMCGLMVLFGTVGIVVSITSQYFSAKAAVGFSCAVRRDLYKRTLSLPRAESDTLGSATLLTRLTADVDRLQNGINIGLRLLLRSPFIVFGAMIMAFLNDWRIALVFLAAVPVLAIVIFVIILWGIPLFAGVQAKLDVLTRHTRDNLRGVRVIRAFRHENEQVEAFDKANDEHKKKNVFASGISALLNPLTYVIVNIAIIMLVKNGVLAVDSGRISQGDLFAIYQYMTMILVELIKLANLIVTLTKSAACAERIGKTLSLPVEDSPNELPDIQSGAPVLEFKNTSFKYRSASGDSLSDVSFSLASGETIGILGGTGSGKTTLIDLIPRMYDATKGEVLFCGADVKDWPIAELRRRIAVVPQSARLFSGTVAENMRWGNADATDEEIKAALFAADALGFVEEKGGLDIPVEQGGSNFSGGQRQRLTIARALVRKPQLLILDDSFSALDYATDLRVRTNIASLDYHPAIVVVSQRPSSVMDAEQILVLDAGDAVGLGTHDKLLANCAVYREIYFSQYGERGQENG
jgi:ABC-type multidrug transport system fused ATPase/permease subunit